jgi:predicted transcriptional regulator of viral defense system
MTIKSQDPPLGARWEAAVRLATRQHGVASGAQLRELGMGTEAIQSWTRRGRLHPVHRGVYAVGRPLLTVDGSWMAAVLACGPAAVVSHRTAAALLGIRNSSSALVEVTAPRSRGRSRAGIRVHSGATLEPRDAATVRGIPCTSVARTLLDLAGVLDRRQVERALEQAEVMRVLDVRTVEEVLGRAAGRRGGALLEAAIARFEPGGSATRSELEERFLGLVRQAGLPEPRANHWIALPGGGVEADFAWPEHTLVVETDGHRVHGTRHAFERDRRRDRRLLLAGWRVARVTWLQVEREPEELAGTLRGLLGAD